MVDNTRGGGGGYGRGGGGRVYGSNNNSNSVQPFGGGNEISPFGRGHDSVSPYGGSNNSNNGVVPFSMDDSLDDDDYSPSKHSKAKRRNVGVQPGESGHKVSNQVSAFAFAGVNNNNARNNNNSVQAFGGGQDAIQPFGNSKDNSGGDSIQPLNQNSNNDNSIQPFGSKNAVQPFGGGGGGERDENNLFSFHSKSDPADSITPFLLEPGERKRRPGGGRRGKPTPEVKTNVLGSGVVGVSALSPAKEETGPGNRGGGRRGRVREKRSEVQLDPDLFGPSMGGNMGLDPELFGRAITNEANQPGGSRLISSSSTPAVRVKRNIPKRRMNAGVSSPSLRPQAEPDWLRAR